MAEALATQAPRERPILFTGQLVGEILAGRKSVTRRLVKPQPNNPEVTGVSPIWGYGVPLPHVDPQRRFGIHAAFNVGGKRVDRWLPCPYGAAGDRLWVRETWVRLDDPTGTLLFGGPAKLVYKQELDAAGKVLPGEFRWKPSIHMRRDFSRVTLEVTGIRVERLRAITDAEVRAEGMSSRDAFFEKWDELHGDGAAAEHPWVWVIDFKKL